MKIEATIPRRDVESRLGQGCSIHGPMRSRHRPRMVGPASSLSRSRVMAGWAPAGPASTNNLRWDGLSWRSRGVSTHAPERPPGLATVARAAQKEKGIDTSDAAVADISVLSRSAEPRLAHRSRAWAHPRLVLAPVRFPPGDRCQMVLEP
jgi:hypothetical protein